MYVPKIKDLEKIWDVAPKPYKPHIVTTADRTPLVRGVDARLEKNLPRAVVGVTPAVYTVDWTDHDQRSWGVIVMEIKNDPDHLVISELWLEEPIQGQGLMSELTRRGYPYWRKRIDYFVIPHWNINALPLFEHIGFRESDVIPGTYGPTSLVADLKDDNGPMAKWYATKEPSEADPTDE